MGHAIFCDRCERVQKLIPNSISTRERWTSLNCGGPSVNDPLAVERPMLLCSTCAAAFNEFMKTGQPDFKTALEQQFGNLTVAEMQQTLAQGKG